MGQDPSPSPSTHPNPSNPSHTTKRVPPPCWTHDETLALIEAYHEKWYSLHRGNLKTSHWQEVGDSVTRRCNLVIPSKTSVQCRHKVEKLRKRYRTEKQRALTAPNRYSSSWIFFKKMDAMEKGSASAVDSAGNAEEDDDEEEDGDVNQNEYLGRYDTYEHKFSSSNFRNFHRPMSNGGVVGGGSGGVHFRIPSGQQRPIPNFTFAKPKNYGRFDEHSNPSPNFEHNPNPMFMNGCGSWSKSDSGRNSGGIGVGNKGKREMDPIAEMVSSIRLLGEGFVKMELMKIDMAREAEKMRTEMELKRTEMILEPQQRIIDAFGKGFSGKKVKRSPPDS